MSDRDQTYVVTVKADAAAEAVRPGVPAKDYVLQNGQTGSQVKTLLEEAGYEVVEIEIFSPVWLEEKFEGACSLVGL